MKQIVVGFVDVETAHQAVREAASLAVQTGASLHIVTALVDAEVEVVKVGADEWRLSDYEQATSVIDQFMANLPETPPFTVAAVEGKPGEILVREAERRDADLIVVGNVRMQGPGRILGSVGNYVTHHAPCNVLIVKTV